MTQEFNFSWQWDLESPPEAIWPFAADTNRFNRDTGQPEVEMLDNIQGTKHLRMKLPLIRVEWEEEPFEWTYPYSFGVRRNYSKGPLDEMNVLVIFDLLPGGGTRLTYKTTIRSGNLLAPLVFPIAVGVVAKKRFEKSFRVYDRIAKRGSVFEVTRRRGLGPGGRSRFKSMSAALSPHIDTNLMKQLEDFIDRADDLSLQRIRPYALADRWGVSRRDVLEMFLRATREGMLDMSWDILCPRAAG